MLCVFYFFFQAEDGIRDLTVTGVQTCALPIFIRDADDGYKEFGFILNEIKKQHPGREVIVSSPDQYYLYAASQMGYKAIFDYENLAKTDVKTTSNTILLIPVHQQEAIIIKDYIDRKKPKLHSTISGTYIYIEEINP